MLSKDVCVKVYADRLAWPSKSRIVLGNVAVRPSRQPIFLRMPFPVAPSRCEVVDCLGKDGCKTLCNECIGNGVSGPSDVMQFF